MAEAHIMMPCYCDAPGSFALTRPRYFPSAASPLGSPRCSGWSGS